MAVFAESGHGFFICGKYAGTDETVCEKWIRQAGKKKMMAPERGPGRQDAAPAGYKSTWPKRKSQEEKKYGQALSILCRKGKPLDVFFGKFFCKEKAAGLDEPGKNRYNNIWYIGTIMEACACFAIDAVRPYIPAKIDASTVASR